jgi:hypothetical protein
VAAELFESQEEAQNWLSSGVSQQIPSLGLVTKTIQNLIAPEDQP